MRVRHRESDHAAATVAQASGTEVGHVTEISDGGFDTLPGRWSNEHDPVHHVRNGLRGNTSARGNILHRGAHWIMLARPLTPPIRSEVPAEQEGQLHIGLVCTAPWSNLALISVCLTQDRLILDRVVLDGE